jgi:hypothetical protein
MLRQRGEAAAASVIPALMVAAVALVFATTASPWASAKPVAAPIDKDNPSSKLNANTITIVAGGYNGAAARFAAELANIKNKDDDPQLIAPRETVSAIAVSNILACYNSKSSPERLKRVSGFSERLVPAIDSIRPSAASSPYHGKRQEVNVYAPMAGWRRPRRDERNQLFNPFLQRYDGERKQAQSPQ